MAEANGSLPALVRPDKELIVSLGDFLELRADAHRREIEAVNGGLVEDTRPDSRPDPSRLLVKQLIPPAIIAADPEAASGRLEGAKEDFLHRKPAPVDDKSRRFLFAAVTGVAFDLDLTHDHLARLRPAVSRRQPTGNSQRRKD